jgi:hypothetical protein
MKKYILYIVLLMLFGFTSVYSQDLQRAKTEDNAKATLPEDPKLSPEENALRLNAGEDNPAKIDVQLPVDPKLDHETIPTEDDYGEANAKAVEVEPDPKLIEMEAGIKVPPASKPVVRDAGGNNQPPGEQIGILHDYRNLPSDGGTQPTGETPENIPNYRQMQGSNEQPQGDAPNK